MARARNIKPGFFRNADLVELPVETRMLFIGLWTLADREGRLEDRPRQIKMEIFPADPFDIDPMLTQLQSAGFLLRYEVDGHRFIEVCNFIKHQDPHYKEKASEIPAPPGKENFHKATGVTRTQRQRIMERDGFMCRSCESEDALCIDHIIPVSRGGDSSDDNLQVLCAGCNTRKGNKIGDEEKNSRQRRVNVGPNVNQSKCSLPSDSLIPDPLIPDSSPTGESADKPRRSPGRAKSESKTLQTYLVECKAASAKPVPDGHHVRRWAEDAGIHPEMLQIAWVLFRDRYTDGEKGKGKRYKDWPGHFATAVKDNWFKLWFADGGTMSWTSQGLTHKTVLDARMAQREADHASA